MTRRIGARPPSAYLAEFAKKNPAMAGTLQTHLIDDAESFGVWNDDYDKFIKLMEESAASGKKLKTSVKMPDGTVKQIEGGLKKK